MSISTILELAGIAHLPKAKQLIESYALNEGFKEAQTEFAQASSPEEAQRQITQFRDLVNRNQVQGNERNVDYWRKQGWEAFSKFVYSKSQEKSKTQEKRSKVEGKSITIHEDPNWLVVVPLDKDASCFHGKNTDWCTTKPNQIHFEDYFHTNQINLIYFLKLDTGDKWAIAYDQRDVDALELFDKNDNQITVEQFTEQTGFNPMDFIKKAAVPDHASQLQASRAEYKAAWDRLQELSPFKELPPDTDFSQIERDLWLTKIGMYIIQYCANVKGRWPKVEKLIASDLEYAFDYAKRVIKGRWPEIEQKILDNEDGLSLAVEYATDVIKGRWPELEERLTDDPDLAIKYAIEASKQRLPVEIERSVLARAYDDERNQYHLEFFM